MRSVGAILLALLLAACAPVARTTFPPIGATPPPAGDATAATQARLGQALAAAGAQLAVSQQPYRPPEGALLAAAPRTVLEASLPNDPTPRHVVVYALPSPAAANAAAADHATYIASNTGRAYFAPSSRFVLQVVGSNVVFFHWVPGDPPDLRLQSTADALRTVGTPVPIPG